MGLAFCHLQNVRQIHRLINRSHLTSLHRQSSSPSIYPPSLTLSSFPSPTPSSSATPTLQHVLTLILPLLTTLPLTLDILNHTSFYPQHKQEDQDLHSGWLQVPRGSLYLVTEAGITEGPVGPVGLDNIRSLQQVMTSQTLDYEFPFSRFSLATDLSFVILTQGKKSAFFQVSDYPAASMQLTVLNLSQTTVNIPLNKDDENDDDLYKPLHQIKVPSDEVLNQWRTLVGGSKIGQTTISGETAKVCLFIIYSYHIWVIDQPSQFIQDDFVNQRSASTTTGKEITSDDLVHCMIMARSVKFFSTGLKCERSHDVNNRLLALSYHEKLVTKEMWEEAKALETRRKARIS